jgi:hypothetical protein
MIVFQHIPKTAGTYVQGCIFTQLKSADVIHCETDSSVLNCPSEVLSAVRVVYGHLSARSIKLRFGSPRVITCLREPVDRVISAYFYWRTVLDVVSTSLMGKSSRRLITVDRAADPYSDLERCICSDELPVYQELRDLQTWMLGYDSRDRNLSDKTVLRLAKKHLDSAALIGDMSSVPDFLRGIAEILGVRPSAGIDKQVNVNVNRPAAKDVPASIRNLIERHNSLDLEIYDYARSAIARRRRPSKRRLAAVPNTFIRPMGPDKVPSIRSNAIVCDSAYQQIEGWLPQRSIDFVSALMALGPASETPASLLGLRPFRGQALIGIGRAIPNLGEIHAAGFEDDHPRYEHSFHSKAICEANLRTFFPNANIRVSVSSELSDEAEGLRTRFDSVTVGVIGRPVCRKAMISELAFFEKSLDEWGFVIVDEVFNPSWPQAADGFFGWLSKARTLVPFMSGQSGGVWLCRPKLQSLFDVRLRGLLGVVWDDVYMRDHRILGEYHV